MSWLPPPPQGNLWNDWGERLNAWLVRTKDTLRQLTTGETAAEDGILMWERSDGFPVVSKSGEWLPLHYSYGSHGMFFDTSDQTATSADTAQAITWGSTAYSRYIAIDGTYSSRINFTKAGMYEVFFSAQMYSNNSSAKTMYFWPRINGVDVSGSTMVNSIDANAQARTVSRGGIFEVSAGDYLEAMFAVSDTGAYLHAVAATAFCPASPSVSIVINEVRA